MRRIKVKNYSFNRKNWPRITFVTIALAIIVLTGLVFLARHIYLENLKPVSSSQEQITVTIPTGTTLSGVSAILEDNKLIRNKQAFESYVRSQGLASYIKAGTYLLQPSQSVQEIVAVLTAGRIQTDLITILPGQRLDQIRKMFLEGGYSEESVATALNPSTYANHPALVDKPDSASLEGYLYPESFQRTSQTTPEDVVRQSLDEMEERLTPDIRSKISRQGLTIYEGVILASIIEQEVPKPEDKPAVAQVFLRRLKEKIALESNATAPYGAYLAGKAEGLTAEQLGRYNSAYNTYIHKGLPPTPVSNFSEESLFAVADPANTSWLFFFSGDDHKTTYFSKTLEEHKTLIKKYCPTRCVQ